MQPPTDWLWDVVVPVVQWGAAVLICIWLAFWLSSVLRRMDEVETPGHRACPNCGYDVRATPERCPECGFALPPDDPEPAQQAEQTMPIYTIPPQAKSFAVVRGADGSFAVAEERAFGGDVSTASKLGFVFIPCRDEPQAIALAEKLNRGEHDGTVQVNLLSPGEREVKP